MTAPTIILIGCIATIIIIIIAVLYRYKPKKEYEHQELLDNIKARIAKANGASIDHYSLETISHENEQHENHYKNADFINKNCTSLETFIINDKINTSDLRKLADLNNITLDVSIAWHPLLIELIQELAENGWDKRISIVKEKYASLRFGADRKYQDIITKYENKSASICETCSEKGVIRHNSDWDYVACRKHYTENRGNVIAKESGFNHNGNFYAWNQVVNAEFKDLDHNEYYRFLVVEFKKDKIKHQGWTDNILYISKNTIGFGNFVNKLPKNFKTIDYKYIESKYGTVVYCEVCGYKAMYEDYCECCENQNLEKTMQRWKQRSQRQNISIDFAEKRIKEIKNNQLFWFMDDGEAFAELHNKYYEKSKNHEISYSEKELEKMKSSMDNFTSY